MTDFATFDVWSVDLVGVSQAPPEWVGLLDAGERDRLGRLRRCEDRLAYAAAHALVRAVAGMKLGRPAGAVRFVSAEGGKPRLAGTEGGRCPSFNLSHAEGMVAVAWAEGHEVGVDVEALERPGLDDALAAFAFAPEEVAALRRLHGAEWRSAFFALWTAKEAVAKAVGLGLSLPLAGIAVDQGAARAALIGEAAALVGNAAPASWALWRRAVGPGHMVTAAVPAGGLAAGEPAVAWRHLDAAGLTALVAETKGAVPARHVPG